MLRTVSLSCGDKRKKEIAIFVIQSFSTRELLTQYSPFTQAIKCTVFRFFFKDKSNLAQDMAMQSGMLMAPPGPSSGGGTIPLALLIDYGLQRTYHELVVLSEL